LSAFSQYEGPVTYTKLNQKTLFVGTGAAIAAATTYAGMLAFCTSSGSGFVINTLYECNAANTAWIAITGMAIARLASDTTSINGTESSGLSIPLSANANYSFKAYLFVKSNSSTPRINFQVHALASGAALLYVAALPFASGTAFSSSLGLVTAVTTDILQNYLAALDDSWAIIIFGFITVGSTATTLQLDLKDTQTGDAVKAGSTLEAVPVA
jgi:hypothetical protein